MVVGSFSCKASANAKMKQLNAAGFDSFIIENR